MCRKVLVFCVFQLSLVYCALLKPKIQNPRVCVIGAGIAGLTSARYLKEEGIDFTVLEATKYVGGTWRYDDRIGQDENGLPLFTSMYRHLRTNLPKPAMQLKGFPLPDDMPSFPSWQQYYNYIKNYAKHFDIYKYIKFLHLVTSVRRVNNVWKVKHKNIGTGEEFEEDYDFIFIGTGHFSKPQLPDIPGEHLFNGSIIHSHDYRDPERYQGRRVLIVGAGPSGMDIGLDVAEVSKTLVHSHHLKVNFRTPFPKHYIKKPDIQEYTENGVIFIDGSFEEIDDVIYCTGFQFHYPFLDESSGLTISSRSVVPLYKYMVNINQPSMIVMGLVVRACIVVALDAQARYATALVKGNFTLPPREVMLEEFQKNLDGLKSKGRKLSDIHLLAEKEDQYYEDLTNESGIDRVPPVLFKIRAVDTAAKLENLYTYRNFKYTIVNKDTFTKTLENGTTSNDSCAP